MTHDDFTQVTEMPGSRVTGEQLARMVQRYGLAQQYAAGNRVLEVSCGSGIGLGMLARQAQSLMAGDFTERVLAAAHSTYAGRVPLLRFDAHDLPFQNNSFELIVNFEAIYYYAQPAQFVRECLRVLRANGMLLIGLENPDWAQFVPGPQSHRHLSVAELAHLLHSQGFADVQFLAGFPVASLSRRSQWMAVARRLVTQSGLFSHAPALREMLKPLVYRNTYALPCELRKEMATAQPLTPISAAESNRDFKVIFALARKSP